MDPQEQKSSEPKFSKVQNFFRRSLWILLVFFILCFFVQKLSPMICWPTSWRAQFAKFVPKPASKGANYFSKFQKSEKIRGNKKKKNKGQLIISQGKRNFPTIKPILSAANILGRKELVLQKEPVVELQEIRRNISGNITTLEFLFDSPTYEYFINSDNNHRHLWIILDNVYMIEDFSNLELGNVGYDIKLYAEEDRTAIELNLDKKTLIQKIDFLESPIAELQIILSNPIKHIADSKVTVNEENYGKMYKTLVRQSKEQKAEELYQEAFVTAEVNLSLAFKKFKHLVANYPEHRSARESLVIMLFNDGKLYEATKILDVGLRRTPRYLPFIRLKALLLTREAIPRIDQAVKLLRTNLPPEVKENLADYYALLATLYLKKGDFIDSLRIYYQLTHLPNPRGIWWVGLATVLEEMGRYNSAKEIYQKALLSPDLSSEVVLKIKEKIS